MHQMFFDSVVFDLFDYKIFLTVPMVKFSAFGFFGLNHKNQ